MSGYRSAACLLSTFLFLASLPAAAAIRTDGSWLKDEQGRTLLLRGINLGGSSKVPVRPNGATHLSDGFFDDRDVSFVGRPFPLADADEHFSRLRAWGMTLVRLVVPWEAIEHAGPDRYDEAYLQYLHDLVASAGKQGLQVIIDPHQDAWSRWTGGSGAPGWTLEAAGMDLRKLQPSGAARLHQFADDASYTDMDWVANYNRYGAAAMTTLFFGGNDFAPLLKVDGAPIQDYLQAHFLAAFKRVALKLRDLPNVAGFGTINEPGRGYIGLADLKQVASSLFLTGPAPAPWEGMLLASGKTQEVAMMNQWGQPAGKTTLNPGKTSLWQEGNAEIWLRHGVWSDVDGHPVLQKPDYFSRRNGKSVDFIEGYLMPFIGRYAATIRSVLPEALIFVEPVAAGKDVRMRMTLPAADAAGMVYAPKWYDGPTKATKSFYRHVSAAQRQDIRQGFVDQLAALKAAGAAEMQGMPVLIGEFGMPMNLDGGRAYASGNYAAQEDAFDSYFAAMEANLLNAAIWNYTADNSHAHGDQWNMEDYSIFSRDDAARGGGRALQAIVRPYPMRTAGTPERLHFDREQRVFDYAFRPDGAIRAPSEIHVPALQYPNGYRVVVTGGTVEKDAPHQLLRLRAAPDARRVTLRIEPSSR